MRKASLGFLALGAFPDHYPLLWRGPAGDRVCSSQLGRSIPAELKEKVGEGSGRGFEEATAYVSWTRGSTCTGVECVSSDLCYSQGGAT